MQRFGVEMPREYLETGEGFRDLSEALHLRPARGMLAFATAPVAATCEHRRIDNRDLVNRVTFRADKERPLSRVGDNRPDVDNQIGKRVCRTPSDMTTVADLRRRPVAVRGHLGAETVST